MPAEEEKKQPSASKSPRDDMLSLSSRAASEKVPKSARFGADKLELQTKMVKRNTEVMVIRKPLVDIYLVESYKEFNYLNTDRSDNVEEDAGYTGYSIL